MLIFSIILSHTPITFTVDMDSGSDVSVLLDFGDGSTPVQHSGGADWNTAWTQTHTYTAGGRYDAVASVSNAEGL